MNNQKVCISKQTTFIALIILFLVAYVAVAIRTMNEKTSTNSRASETKEQMQRPIPTYIPRDCKSQNCIGLTQPVVYNRSGIQFVNPLKNAGTIDPKATYAVFAYPLNSFRNSAKQVFTVPGKELESRLKTVNFQNIGVTPDNIKNMEFKLFRVK